MSSNYVLSSEIWRSTTTSVPKVWNVSRHAKNASRHNHGEDSPLRITRPSRYTREFADVFPYKIPAVLPADRSVRHEIDLVPGSKYCVTRQWPLPRDQVEAIDASFKGRQQAGHVRESTSPHSSPTFCVKKATGGSSTPTTIFTTRRYQPRLRSLVKTWFSTPCLEVPSFLCWTSRTAFIRS